MKQGQRRTRTPKLDTGIDADIAAAEAKLKSLREQKKENERKFLEKNQKAILALLSEFGLDRVPASKWVAELGGLTELLIETKLKPVIAEPAKFEEWSSEPEQVAA